MKEIVLILHEDVTLSTTTGAMDMLIHTNSLFHQSGKPLPFKIILAGEEVTNQMIQVSSPYVSYKNISEIGHADLIIVPAFYGDRDLSLKKHHKIILWLNTMYQNGSEVASMCSGSYFLAEAGLLSGRSCTSHWNDKDDIIKRYPDVNFLSEMVITDQEGIYTSGGAFSSLNLILYLIDKFCGRE